MSDRILDVAAGTQSWVNELEAIVRTGGDRSRQALTELSAIALGGNRQARMIVDGLDRDITLRELALPPEPLDTERSPSISWVSGVIFALTHPLEAIRSKTQHVMGSIEGETPSFTNNDPGDF